jgi:hypothetical protein
VARALLHALGRGRKHSRGRRDDPPPIADELPRPLAHGASAARCRDSARALPDSGARAESRSRCTAATIRRPAAESAAAATRDPSSPTRGARRRTGPGSADAPAFASLRRRPGCRTRDPTTCSSNREQRRFNSRGADRIRAFGATRVPGRRFIDSGRVSANGSSESGNRRSGRDGRVLRRRRGGSVVEWFRCRSGRFDDRRTDARARLGVATGDESRSVQSRVASPT